MFRRFGARASLLVVALLAVTALVPLAAADHAYSHRFIVYGRVVDANGDPVQGVTVDFGYRDFTPEGPCANQPDTETEAYGRTTTIPVTNGYGEFMFCVHTHSMSRALPGTGILRIPEEGNQTMEFEMDPYFRVNYVTFKLDHASERANKTSLDHAFVVQGRYWVPHTGTVNVEGVGVFGHTVDNVPVNITFAHDGQTEQYETRTNNYGDFAYRVNTTTRPTSGTVTVSANGETRTYTLGADEIKTGILTQKIRIDAGTDPVVKGLLIGLGVIVGVAVVGGAGLYGYRRMAAKREEANIRATTNRKRANK